MDRSSIAWSAVIVCIFWIAWFGYDSIFNSGLLVSSAGGAGTIRVWKVDLQRFEVLILEIAATAVTAMVLSVLLRDRRDG